MTRVSIIVPVLDECLRLARCLDGLIAQGPEVREILVVDGGSTDGTQKLVFAYTERDPRVRLIEAGIAPERWNGKVWNLQTGYAALTPESTWMLTVDADVRVAPGLARALLAHAARTRVPVFSVAARQELGSIGEGLVHPALLATLVYRFGRPGHAAHRICDAQANGQCFLLRRDLLDALGGFAPLRDSVCEDVTLARMLVASGIPVGFYEAGDLVRVRMYTGGAETWRNWTRSLPLRDRYWGRTGVLGLLEVTLVQALPLAELVGLAFVGLVRARRSSGASGGRAAGFSPRPAARIAAMLLTAVMVALRLGVLAGTARTYTNRPWSYWLSPLVDLPAAAALWASALRRRHSWRGRAIVRGAGGESTEGVDAVRESAATSLERIRALQSIRDAARGGAR